MLVAGHRGVRVGAEENTMEAFRMAAEAGVDMIETDTHMTKDGQIILMHDHTVDRTTKGHGLIRDLTYREILEVGPKVPTLEEFLDGMKDYPEMTYNFELKDYPADGEAWAWESLHKTVRLVEQYRLEDRCVMNSFSGQLLERVDEEYAHRFKLHGFYPFSILGEHSRNPMEYLFCACIFDRTVVPGEEMFRTLEAGNVEPWIGAGVKEKADLLACEKLGARLVTTDDPVQTLRFLREEGLHA